MYLILLFFQIIVDLADSDSSVEEFEDASESFTGEDEMFVEDIGPKKLQPLSKYSLLRVYNNSIHKL